MYVINSEVQSLKPIL